ncbi:50S ribosomal protein L16 [Patescibacteria group bacterium]|nr:MAG: 50S ribosomal protein L16 [Patescibacteria group bacterium]
MLMPRKMKYRKQQRGKMRGSSKRGSEVEFGRFGLRAKERGWFTAQQIEAARRAITRYIRRGGKIWVRVFPDKPVTKKALEVPMGSGKGDVEKFVAVVLPGRVLFEMDGISESVAKEALRLAANKIPFKTKFFVKEEVGVQDEDKRNS